ncbi:6666_t:CDS:2 [Funneliformis mosseae]|uniref:6666_t:CDS:1 n=1 Tax=Funneliformis mosseae TaxID=27381 RepID=A0A9N8ZKV3_FUNMO|nr:6666_t:CDS:2 [Funneliformis mosseae]
MQGSRFIEEFDSDLSPPRKNESPLEKLMLINKTQFITFVVALLAWTSVSFNFFIVTFTLPYIARDFNLRPSDVAISITFMLIFRPLGALIFGLLSDRYGRKYTLMVDIVMSSGLQLASGFAPNFSIFVITRALFGVAMGGEWGLGAALTMETLPSESRGLLSGVLQEESEEWQRIRALRKKSYNSFEEIRLNVTNHWRKFFFTIFLMTALNFVIHGSKDLYPTFLNVQLDFTPGQITFITTIANVGSLIGGVISGYINHFAGRKNTMMGFIFFTACFLPLYVMPKNHNILAIGAFVMYLCISGCWGVIPVYLNDISPVEFRGTFPGLVYQIGTLLAASSAQIEAFFGETLIKDENPNYGLTIALLTGFSAFIIILILNFTKYV